ncbi:hypothetical protein H1R20_g1460, partial [Candolleomyces eurysporus]
MCLVLDVLTSGAHAFLKILLNGSRLGFYEPFRHSFNSLFGQAPTAQIPFTSVLAGATSGAVGAALGNPLFLIKARMQVQLPSYNFTKRTLISNGILPEDSTWTFLASSSVSGACVLVCMQPADTALTRVYNQPTVIGPDGKSRGALYKNPIDCLWKTFKAEGVRGWYKGSTAHFMRIAPHTIITLTANDIIINFYKKAKYGPVDDDS